MRFFAFNLDCVALCLALWLVGASGVLAQECKFVEDTCIYEGGIYHIRVPDVVDPNYRSPVVMILHDAGENGSAIINDERLIETFVDKGYAVIAPDALPRRKVRFHYKIGGPGLGAKGTRKRYRLPLSNKRFVITDINGTVRLLKSGKHTGWYFYNVDQGVYSYGPRPKIDLLGRNEIQFLRDALSDAEEKHGIDPTPVLVIGLGHGGSLVWQIACYAPKFGRILAPIGGAFWRKIPKNCRPGANLIHTHHRASKFWPLKGAKGNKRRYARTSISRNLERLIGANRCGPDKVITRNDEFGANHTTWSDCGNGGPVELLLLDEPFAFQDWWLDEMLDRVEKTGIKRPLDEVPEKPGPAFEAAGTGTGFKTPGAGTGFKAPDARAGFKVPGAGTGFKAPGAGTGFKTPGTGTDSPFKRLK